MIVLHESVIESFAILQLAISQSGELDCIAECYQNGREQGFLLFGFKNNKAIYWSHHRNSDSVIVYVGDYSMQGLSENAYRNTYMPVDMYDAVDYIVNTAKALQEK